MTLHKILENLSFLDGFYTTDIQVAHPTVESLKVPSCVFNYRQYYVFFGLKKTNFWIIAQVEKYVSIIRDPIAAKKGIFK